MDAERLAEFEQRLGEVLEEFAAEADVELGAVADWVMVVTVAAASDPAGGTLTFAHPPHQWKHRTVGLLRFAQRRMEQTDDEEDC